MHLTADLAHIDAADIIVVANNRQVLAFKKTYSQQHPNTQLPNIFSWQQYLKHYWQSQQFQNDKCLIGAIEQRYLLESSLEYFDQVTHIQLINEVVKNYDYCTNHLIELSSLSNSKIQICEVFAQWINHYQQTKQNLNLVDTNDLGSLILGHPNQLQQPYVYGFKTLTPLQQKIFNALNYQTINSEYSNVSEQRCFENIIDEISSAAIWAKQQSQEHPQHSIVIVCPQLSELQHQLISIFDQAFNDQLVETGKKSYNISLGLALSQYNLVQDCIELLELSDQLKSNKINTTLFTQVMRSVYVKGHQQEQSARHLLANQAKALALEYFQLDKLELESCPILLEIIDQIKTIPSNIQSLSNHLASFNNILSIWGFAADRALSSSEYQLFKKYLSSTLKLNQLSLHHAKCSSGTARHKLTEITNQVVFQAQASKTNVQIIGSLEAEGLRFDQAWVMGMTHDFLPAKLNTPRFISSNIAIQHHIPYSSYELVQSDAQNTLNNLSSLADSVIFSYAKSHFESEQLPSPLLDFPEKSINQVGMQTTPIATKFIGDEVTIEFKAAEVKSGVSLLKDQMACAFKGFAHRLNIEHYDEPHIGLDRREQGNIIHTALQYIYEEVDSKSSLAALDQTELASLISRKIFSALKRYEDSGFKNIEKIRLESLLLKFIETDKLREDFRVLATERSVQVDIAGLSFNTRLDRLDQMDNGDQIVFDYKTGNTSIAKWCGQAITEPQLPIYSITNNAQGAAFIELNSSSVSFKGLSKDPDSLPKQSSYKGKCQQWDEQLATWKTKLDQASEDFQSGQAQVLPNKTACDYCEFDLLCRIQR
ncbi:FIG01199495: hypothetical protein [uncultured Candidatus Thioglobus sp.]|nr:FIG01199495: hypothetical protein [uncultured Candidatus Thioglobus sp.]